jgi:hypothetical protein
MVADPLLVVVAITAKFVHPAPVRSVRELIAVTMSDAPADMGQVAEDNNGEEPPIVNVIDDEQPGHGGHVNTCLVANRRIRVFPEYDRAVLPDGHSLVAPTVACTLIGGCCPAWSFNVMIVE